MKRVIAAGLLMSWMIASHGWAKKYVYGPAPDWETYKTLADAAVRAQLPDPDNWVISWPYGYSQAGWPGPKNVRGYLTCGLMQARVPVANRDPVIMLTVVIDYGEVKNVDFATRQRNHRVNVICPVLINGGRMPPARLMEAPQIIDVPSLGIAIRAVGAGAYVTEVKENSAGTRAGLKPGMVLTQVNGVALSGAGTAMAGTFGGDAGELTLSTAAGDHIVVKRTQSEN